MEYCASVAAPPGPSTLTVIFIPKFRQKLFEIRRIRRAELDVLPGSRMNEAQHLRMETLPL